jgi:hypothetical protein
VLVPSDLRTPDKGGCHKDLPHERYRATDKAEREQGLPGFESLSDLKHRAKTPVGAFAAYAGELIEPLRPHPPKELRTVTCVKDLDGRNPQAPPLSPV